MYGESVDYEVGDVIEYGPFGGGTRTVRVEEKEADIKNGRPGFGGVLLAKSAGSDGMETGSGCWGYDEQIIRRVSRGAAGTLRVASTRLAPVAAIAAAKPGQCTGSGRRPTSSVDDGGRTTCPGCEFPISVRTDGAVRGHKRPALR